MKYRTKRSLVVGALLAIVALFVALNPASYEREVIPAETQASAAGGAEIDDNAGVESGGANADTLLATEALQQLEIKGRAPKTGYNREEFYNGWPDVEGCSLRQRIIKREFGDTAKLDADKCRVIAGEYNEPYTGVHLVFATREQISDGIQIDHVVALSDAWQKGAQYFDQETRRAIATDPLNLLAVDASANQQKSDGDAATWLPSNKAFRCQYIARQISVKKKYQLWVTQAEYDAMLRVLEACPSQTVIE